MSSHSLCFNVPPILTRICEQVSKFLFFGASQHRLRLCTKWHKKKRKAETWLERVVNNGFGVFRNKKMHVQFFKFQTFCVMKKMLSFPSCAFATVWILFVYAFAFSRVSRHVHVISSIFILFTKIWVLMRILYFSFCFFPNKNTFLNKSWNSCEFAVFEFQCKCAFMRLSIGRMRVRTLAGSTQRGARASGERAAAHVHHVLPTVLLATFL
jgi:hypothetical protein